MQLKKSPRETTYEQQDDGEVSDHLATDQYYEPQRMTPGGQPPHETISRASGAQPESVIDAHSTFNGTFESEQDLRIEGVVSGEITCKGTITIERDATATARITAMDANVRGRLDGDVVCTGRLLIASTAVVTGTLKAATLAVEEGANIKGTIETIQAPSQPARASRASNEAAPAAADAAPEASTAPTPVSTTTSRRREVPSFALVSSDDRTARERN